MTLQKQRSKTDRLSKFKYVLHKDLYFFSVKTFTTLNITGVIQTTKYKSQHTEVQILIYFLQFYFRNKL